MKKKGNLLLICIISVMIFFTIMFGTIAVSFVSATALDLKITAEVNNLSSDVWLKTNIAFKIIYLGLQSHKRHFAGSVNHLRL